MLESIRSALYKKSLQRVLATQKRRRQAHNLDSAKKIGILFDATTEKTRHEVMEYARELVEKGKSVRLFGYFKTKQPPEGHAFNFFFQKETTWAGVPKSEKASAFAEEKFDMLIYLDPEECLPLEWLAAASQAAMKVGYATDRPNDFDLLLETPDGKGLLFFTEQLHLYLDKIVLSKNESARAI
ncbi:MAG: hypothetical protein EPGJADBJ_01100 [Saprospiraceae bacterium]|nr:hypothetical protein [Saprospiraceae bacterium]